VNRAELEGIAREWMALDPDPRTREATEAMLRGDDEEGLRAHFGSRLQFGTAGIRGALGPGPGRMNRRLVRLVTAGLGRYLLATVERAGERGVVVGYDARHMSREFAADTAAVLASLGLRVWLYDEQVPTPQLAHAVVALGCAAGVMVTASHNPPADNGYKVYWGNGAQIIPPHDRGISAAIDAVDAVGVEEGLDALRRAGRVEVPPAQVLKDYLTAVDRLRVHRVTGARLVYTAMHGVGLRLVEAVLGAARE